MIDRTETRNELEDALLAVLRMATSRPALEFDGQPGRLEGGFWAELVSFRLRGGPAGWEGGLVARVMPNPDVAVRETAIQAEVAAQGYPTPAVRLAGGPDDGLGRAFIVMDLATGGPLLDGLGTLGAVIALPRLLRRLPATLAIAMARLHRLDPSRVRARRAGAGLGIGPLISGFGAAASSCDRADLVAAARWLQEHPPRSALEVVCHGDLHPFNVLVAADGSVTVLDWSAALLAPAAYDVAFTGLVLVEPPIAVPSVLRPAVRAAGRILARRFRADYARLSDVKIDADSLRWYEGVVCLRALSEVAEWVAAGTAHARVGHPWVVSGPAFATRLSALTGVSVRSR